MYHGGTTDAMLAVAGGKGGCGKTTTTLGLAGALARAEREVVAVDADRAMPNLHELAGVPRDPGLPALDTASLEAVGHVYPDNPRVRIVPAGEPTADCSLTQALTNLPDTHQTLIDCPAGAGTAAAAPLRIADRTLLVSTPNPASLCDAVKTAAMARALSAPPIGVVLTRCETPPAGIGRLFDCTLLGCISLQSDKIFENRQTVVEFDTLLGRGVLGNI
ncbi:MinD/ParA family ATP-binding protein [Haladaptatus sp. ZSTT2]|uniref:MinD/ParA family ATP-binding protein n=1 Tax=Haladaptatus sp. ZSTT2 TaxID=3120515 RepID=UPI00300E810B